MSSDSSRSTCVEAVASLVAVSSSPCRPSSIRTPHRRYSIGQNRPQLFQRLVSKLAAKSGERRETLRQGFETVKRSPDRSLRCKPNLWFATLSVFRSRSNGQRAVLSASMGAPTMEPGPSSTNAAQGKRWLVCERNVRNIHIVLDAGF